MKVIDNQYFFGVWSVEVSFHLTNVARSFVNTVIVI